MPDWDADSVRLQENLAKVAKDIRAKARARAPASLGMAKSWHETFMEGLAVPDRLYVGRFRGEAGLERTNVRVGAHTGTPAKDVASELSIFEHTLNGALSKLDALIPAQTDLTADQANAVLDVCGWAHAEWVRIHPFANGNGRAARLWTNFVAVRYGLPPFLRLRPRPNEASYAAAGANAMAGNWEPTARMMRELLDKFLDECASRLH